MIDFQIENDDLKNQQLNQHFYFENWLMINFQSRNGAIYIGPTRNAFSLKEMTIFFKIAPIKMFKLIKIQFEIFAPLEIFGPLQTLFPSLKIAIFWRIAPQLGRAEFFV